MATLDWSGERACLRASSATLSLTSGAPSYSFQDADSRPPVLDTGPLGGQRLVRDVDWTEASGGDLYDRLLSLGFYPRETDGNDLAEDAFASGWTLTGMDARDNSLPDQRDVLWRDSHTSGGDVGVPSSTFLFACEEFVVNFRRAHSPLPPSEDASAAAVVGTFRAADVRLGAFLPPGYDASAVPTYNPCAGFNGQRCAAVDGRITCGGAPYEVAGQGSSSSPAPTATTNLDWYAPNSFLEARNAFVSPSGGGPDYSFRDHLDRSLVIDPPDGGSSIIRDADWEEEEDNILEDNSQGDGVLYRRGLIFRFKPTGDPIIGNTDAETARETGYRIYRTEMRNGVGFGEEWTAWDARDAMRFVVPVSDGYDYFHCEQVEINFLDGSTFRAENVRVGGYLKDNYSLSRLVPYNPCRALSVPGPCRGINGIVFCGGLPVYPSGEGPTPPPSPAPVSLPPPDTGVDIVWRGDRVYVSAVDVEGLLTMGPNYKFGDDYGRNFSYSVGPDGLSIQVGNGDWFEGDVQRSVYFRAYSYADDAPSSGTATVNGGGNESESAPSVGGADVKPLALETIKMRTNANEWGYWTEGSGAFKISMIAIPRFYDAFQCQYAEFTFRGETGGNVLGTFRMSQFVFGGNLREGYDPSRLRLFDPCRHVDEEEYNCRPDNPCLCAVVNAQVLCNGKIVPYEDLAPKVGLPPAPAGQGGTDGDRFGGTGGDGALGTLSGGPGKSEVSGLVLAAAALATISAHVWGLML